MADSHHIIDGKVVPYSGGRKCNDTDAWRDATPLELQLQEQLAEYEHAISAKDAEIEALRAEVEEWKDAARCASEQQDSLFREARALNERADKLRAEVESVTCELMDATTRADKLAEALRLALDSHGVMLMTDPPQDAWKVRRVEEIGRALLRDQEEGNGQ